MKLDAIIRNAGFRLERQRKHKIYKHAELGETLVVASTPSDHRTGANTLAQLSRLTGIRKRELIAPPVRGARRNEHKVENLPVPPKDPPVEIVPEVQPTAPTPMTPAERKYLKRMEKHEIQRQLKLGRQRQRLQAALDRCHEFFIHEMFESGAVHCEDEREDLHDLTALSLYFAVKARMGFHDVELMAAEVLINQTVGNIPVVRVGCWYLDYFGGEVHDTTEWEAKIYDIVCRVSVFGALRVMEEGDGFTISD